MENEEGPKGDKGKVHDKSIKGLGRDQQELGKRWTLSVTLRAMQRHVHTLHILQYSKCALECM